MYRTLLAGSCFLVSQTVFAVDLSEFQQPAQIQADGRPIDVQREGHSAPFFGDFDGDGLKDLLVGEFNEGRLRIYRNVGTADEAKFGDFEWFRAGAELGRVPTG